MLRMIVIAVYIFACLKWGNWRNWKDYYSTILYVIVGDLAYNFVFCDHYLWRYKGLVNHTFSDILYLVTGFPAAIILFFTFYPTNRRKVPLYILLWTAINTIIEGISSLTGYFVYYRGWNLIFSAGTFLVAFILIAVHKKNPLIVWPISLGLGALTMFVFHIPITVLD